MFMTAFQNRALSAASLATVILWGLASPAASSSFGPSWDAFSMQRASDLGGSVLAYYSDVHSEENQVSRTVISGVCASACTMKLSLRNACIEPNAVLLFHQASNNGVRSELATRIMLDAYPPRIRRWVLRSGALKSSYLTALSGREAIAMGVRRC